MRRRDKATEQKIKCYAESAFNIGKAEGKLEQLKVEFEELKSEIESNLDFREYLADSSISDLKKINMIFEILGENSTNAIKAIACMLVTMGVIELAGRIFDYFSALVKKFALRETVEIISALELDSKFINRIKRIVDKKTGLDVKIINVVNDRILGGVVIKIGDKMIDLSIKSKMEELKTRLKALEFRGDVFGFNNTGGQNS